jgi:hypothetical protein
MDQDTHQAMWSLMERVTRLEMQIQHEREMARLRCETERQRTTSHTFGVSVGLKDVLKLGLAVLLPLLVLIATGDKQQARHTAQTLLLP